MTERTIISAYCMVYEYDAKNEVWKALVEDQWAELHLTYDSSDNSHRIISWLSNDKSQLLANSTFNYLCTYEIQKDNFHVLTDSIGHRVGFYFHESQMSETMAFYEKVAKTLRRLRRESVKRRPTSKKRRSKNRPKTRRKISRILTKCPHLKKLNEALSLLFEDTVVVTCVQSFFLVQLVDVKGVLKHANTRNWIWPRQEWQEQGGMYVWEPPGWEPEEGDFGMIFGALDVSEQSKEQRVWTMGQTLYFCKFGHTDNIVVVKARSLILPEILRWYGEPPYMWFDYNHERRKRI